MTPIILSGINKWIGSTHPLISAVFPWHQTNISLSPGLNNVILANMGGHQLQHEDFFNIKGCLPIMKRRRLLSLLFYTHAWKLFFIFKKALTEIQHNIVLAVCLLWLCFVHSPTAHHWTSLESIIFTYCICLCHDIKLGFTEEVSFIKFKPWLKFILAIKPILILRHYL